MALHDVVVIGASAGGVEALQRLAAGLAAGFDRHYTKPADSETLRRLIDEFPRHRSRGES